MIDAIDREIIKLLKDNSRIQWKEIGEKIHISGQAVGARVKKLEDTGVIEAYTVKIDGTKIDQFKVSYIMIYMTTTDHAAFKEFINKTESIVEAHRISGQGCYILKIETSGDSELAIVLDKILAYANYQLNASIERIK